MGVGEVGLCLGTVFGDVDDDGDPDLYVVNDFGRNTLYRNDGDRFTDVTVASGTLDYGAGMNASLGDVDNDGRLDLYVTNIRSEFAWFGEWPMVRLYMLETLRQGVWRTDYPLFLEMMWQSGPELAGIFQKMGAGNSLLRNRGDGTFEDVTRKAAANPPGWFWGAALADLDNDGWQDLWLGNGDPSMDRSEASVLLRRTAGGFRNVTFAAGLPFTGKGHGANLADLTGDGRLHLIVASGGLYPGDLETAAVYRPRRRPGRYLAVRLVGTRSNRDAIGARLVLSAGGREQHRWVSGGTGFGCLPYEQHFGLGELDRVDALRVLWPSGLEQTFEQVPIDAAIRVVEGMAELEVR